MAGTAVALNHQFVSAKADGPDATLVRASNWNAVLAFSAGADGQKLIRDSSQSPAGASWLDAETCSLTNQTGGAAAVGDVVAISAANDSSVVLDDTQGSLNTFVVALATPANAAAGPYAQSGLVLNVKATGAIPRGNYVRKSATTKTVEDTGVAAGPTVSVPKGALGLAVNAAAAGVVNLMWFGSASGAGGESYALTNQTGAGAAVGDVVALSAANDSAVVLDDTQTSLKKFVVSLGTPLNGAVGQYAKSGVVVGVKAQGAIPRGNYVRKSATTKAVEDTGIAMGTTSAAPPGTLGVALTAAAAGVVTVEWFDATTPLTHTSAVSMVQVFS